MPFTQVKIDTLQCGSDKLITVDKQIVKVLQKGDQIKFHNNLDGNVEATIRFYPIDSKGSGEIGGFCTEMSGLTLQVPGTGSPTVCTTDTEGDFAYEIEASPSHKPLDPVIIIDPIFSLQRPMPELPDGPPLDLGLFGGASLLAMSAPLFLGGLLGIFLGRYMR
ncbi:MAG: hypothetical protein EX272_12360 [Chromatiales bacterium]|nr:MAG: hypothetical protein EX272_12360 [Chromatiales bacterium]